MEKDYLNKFFQLTIRVPTIIGENLEEYTLELINERSPGPLQQKQKEIVRILSSGIIGDPRKINLLLNNIVALYTLAKMKEGKDKQIDSGVITEHIDVLTVLTIIEHEWPDFYKQLVNQHQIWTDVNNDTKNIDSEIPRRDELIVFLDVVDYTPVDSIEPFLRLSRSVIENENTKKLDEIMKSHSRDDIRKYIIEKKNDKNTTKKFIKAISNQRGKSYDVIRNYARSLSFIINIRAYA